MQAIKKKVSIAVLFALFISIFGILGSNANAASTIKIPTSVKQTGLTKADSLRNYGSWKWMGKQKDVCNTWKNKGKKSKYGIATTDGRYLVAVKSKFGKVGSKITVNLKNGTTVKCIIADHKRKDTGSSWGDVFNRKVSIVEWMCKNDNLPNLPKSWKGKAVKSITNGK